MPRGRNNAQTFTVIFARQKLNALLNAPAALRVMPKTQSVLAKRLGVSLQTFNSYFGRDNDTVPVKAVSEICKAFVIPEDLFTSDEYDSGNSLSGDFIKAVEAHWHEERHFKPAKPILAAKLLQIVYDFDNHAYVDGTGDEYENISFSKFAEWYEAYDEGFLCAFEQLGPYEEPIAVMGLFPVTETWAKDFLSYRLDERELSHRTITEANKRTWYFSGLSSRQSGMANALRRNFSSFLGHGILRWASNNAATIGRDEIVIIAEGTTVHGQDLLERLNFKREAVKLGHKPRYKLKTSLSDIRQALTEHSYFKDCAGLSERAFEDPELKKALDEKQPPQGARYQVKQPPRGPRSGRKP
jgi:hypothetical protein